MSTYATELAPEIARESAHRKRPEVNSIISRLPKQPGLSFIGSSERVTELIQAFSDHDVKRWNPHPVNAIATGLLHATRQPESPASEVSAACLNYLRNTTPESLPDIWLGPLLGAVADAGESYFSAAQQDFDAQDIVSGAANLSRAVNCAIIGQAAIRGWPHADADINTIVGLASGRLPTSITEFNEIIDAMPDHQLDLNSAYSATAAVLDVARYGYFHDFGYTPERATEMARHAFEMVSRTRATVS